MTLYSLIQRNDSFFDLSAGHRYEPVPGIFTVIFQAPIFAAYGAQVPLLLDVIASVFVKFRIEAIFFPEQGIDQMKGSIEICCHNPI